MAAEFLTFLIAAAATSPVSVVPIDEAQPEIIVNAQVTLEKSALDRSHPDHVRCRTEPVQGSLAKKRRICMTNKEWKHAIRLGNKYARQFVADQQPGFFIP